MEFVKILFKDKELKINEYDFVQILKMLKIRNKRLYVVFAKFYINAFDEGFRSLFDGEV